MTAVDQRRTKPVPARTLLGGSARLSRRLGGREGVIGWSLLAVLVLIALLAPLLAPHSAEAIDDSRVFGSPTAAHPLGSDDLGRDVLSRILFAYRVSLGIAVGSVVLAMLIGIPLGVLAGYAGGWVDLVLMRAVDLLLAFPALLLAISLIAILGPGSGVALLAIAVIYIPIMARVVRGSVLVVRNQPYVAGARTRGVSHLRIVWGHVLPNSIGPALVQASVLTAFAIIIEASLSFLGLGAQPPTPELGLMLAEGNNYLTQAPWVEIFPGLAISLTVFAFNMIGDGLRRGFDPYGMAR
ncbi:ABC transporter permease [Actinacidiphila sp. ITFR-21]|uniref:ABC transporter permease n=1 Tax=Actinacidiphila sp. ITFR-21 TaxID=3075199 RepID=UPI00288B8F84|nr:ABC transporter permease [Streptomyces sp. ITFR-21]WNI15392.1 ABC transporter permease [Streptomyces sp. ITFR-21]